MKSNYKPIGVYIRLVDERNVGLKVTTLLGLSISKKFIPSVANTIGSDMENYKIIRKNQFACSLMQVRRDKKIPVALLQYFEEAIISQAYPVFEVIDEDALLPEYLMMWFSRSEFDRESCFYAVGGVRGSLEWEDFCNMQLPIPSLEKQKEIVAEYNIIVDRIKLNEQLNQKLEETAQAIYKQWFVDFEFPDEKGKPYRASGGEMEYEPKIEFDIPLGWSCTELKELVEHDSPITYGVVKPGPQDENGVLFIRGGDIKSGFITVSELRTITNDVSRQYNRTKLNGGELIVSLVGNPGAVAIVPFSLKDANIARQVALVRIRKDFGTIYTLYYLTSRAGQDRLRNETSGSVQQVINLEDLRMVKILVPDSKTLNTFNSVGQELFNLLEGKRHENERLRTLMQILLSKQSAG